METGFQPTLHFPRHKITSSASSPPSPNHNAASSPLPPPASSGHLDQDEGELRAATMAICEGAADPSAESDLLQQMRGSFFFAPSLSLCVEEKLIRHRCQPPTPCHSSMLSCSKLGWSSKLEASAEEAKREEDGDAAHRRMQASAMAAGAAWQRVHRGGPGVCARSFAEQTKLLHFLVASSDESQNGFRFRSPVGGLFSAILIYFQFESPNGASIEVSLSFKNNYVCFFFRTTTGVYFRTAISGAKGTRTVQKHSSSSCILLIVIFLFSLYISRTT
jgi:hypothetical protein